MPSSIVLKEDIVSEFNVQKIQAKHMEAEIDIHFNRDALIKGCSHCLWYNGYIGSAFFDEFELKLNAYGNIRARIYKDFDEVESINDSYAYSQLIKYYNNDKELEREIVREEYSEELLESNGGNAIFVVESNWLELSCIDHLNNEEIESFELDTEDIFEPFMCESRELVNYCLE